MVTMEINKKTHIPCIHSIHSRTALKIKSVWWYSAQINLRYMLVPSTFTWQKCLILTSNPNLKTSYDYEVFMHRFVYISSWIFTNTHTHTHTHTHTGTRLKNRYLCQSSAQINPEKFPEQKCSICYNRPRKIVPWRIQSEVSHRSGVVPYK